MPDRSEDDYEKQKSRSRDWKRRNKERHAELARAYRRRNPEKLKAQNRLNYAIRMGLIERGPCEECGTTENVHAHHEDYSKPYDVHWLCYKCHKKAHPVTEKDKRVKFKDAKRASFRGESNNYSKLSNDDIGKIFDLLEKGVSQATIGEMFGVAQTTISQVSRGKTWSHVGSGERRASRSGKRKPKTRITKDVISEIRALLIHTRFTQKRIAEFYGISASTVRVIRSSIPQ